MCAPIQFDKNELNELSIFIPKNVVVEFKGENKLRASESPMNITADEFYLIMTSISKEELFVSIKEIAAIRAPSGLENARAKKFIDLMKKYISADQIDQDPLGNVIIRIPSKRENAPKIMIVGHIDEIGATVLKIKEDGRLLFQKRGGFETRWLISKRVYIYTLQGKWVQGVVLGRTIHAMPPGEREKALPDMNSLEIFLGADSAAEIKELGIHVGAPIVFEGYTDYLNADLNKDLIISNSLDNILSLAAFLELAARIGKENPYGAEIILVAAVREEIGREGSAIIAEKIRPNVCIGIDFGTAETAKNAIDSGATLKGGPIIVWAEEQGLGVFDYNLAKQFVEAADLKSIPYQHGLMTFYGSDAGIIQKKLGIPSVLIAPPLFAGHNVPEIASLTEIYRCTDLIIAWLDYKYSR